MHEDMEVVAYLTNDSGFEYDSGLNVAADEADDEWHEECAGGAGR
jgi:hypothetical protein